MVTAPGPARVLVTGGSGFLGAEICRQLTARGTETVSFSRRPSRTLEQLGVRQVHGDLVDRAALDRAVPGCDAVVHNAALAGISGAPGPYWRTNVAGTRTVIDRCRAHGVRTLVHTSTASVVFRPGGLENADERLPYPVRHLAAYPHTKAVAEALVLDANGPELAALSLRPHLIWGPGDPHFVPALTRLVRRQTLVMPGSGANLVDTTHVRTAAHAHLLALDLLHQGQPVGGRAYFIAQGEPLPLGGFLALLLATAGIRATWRPVPVPLAVAAAAAREAVSRLRRGTGSHAGTGTRDLSRFLVAELVHPHWFDLTAARRDLGFTPPIGLAEGMRHAFEAAGRPGGGAGAIADLLSDLALDQALPGVWR
ncbi:NAD-dependent epimerase/dehydratase family protein [Kitasatospora acidiphila]|uniref:NAD-dependent epimerase/dehydratase family protein n=1 Tax=Kitasatospora acidiphila TaxID=2567942 RepID=A0A540W0T6_9ACTN|nr:NAD-dependent epimerase/dehydratase family protein [Kitasatospora acidiphila]TQF02635.1 NAD-dependent epimerase/dehydratase family protein [Kitasatospora acidiphila]